MHETAFSFSQLESPAPGASLPPGKHLLRGWVMPKPGGHFVDVRARIGPRVFAGVHGVPRSDLAAHFNTGRSLALAEFSVIVELASPAADVVLEVLGIEGHWTSFQTARYQVAMNAPAADLAAPTGPLRWHEYGRALQILLREQHRQPTTPLVDLARQLVAEIPYPRDLRHPHHPFRGHLDEPAALTRCGFGRTAVLGYLFHESQPIKRVLATFDLQAWQTVGHRQPSPGPVSYFPQFAAARNCGLFGLLDVPAQLPNPICLRLYAELADGSLHLCSVQRSRRYTSEDEKAPYPPQDRANFTSSHLALSAALMERGIEVVADDEMRRELARREEDFFQRAPRSEPVARPLEPAPLSSTAPLPRRVLLVTHNLNLEGAPLFLVDYARYLAALGVRLTLLSPSDGPLRVRFAEYCEHILITDASPVFAAGSVQEARAAIDLLARSIVCGAFDLVVCNTFTTFWAVHAAKSAGRRVLLYVHESTTPENFYRDRLHAAVVTLANDAFSLADCVSFTTASTRSYHLEYGRPASHRLTPGWIDVDRIDAWRSTHPRGHLRAQFRLQPGELLVTNVGTVSHRKGQHTFARAVDLLWRRYPELAARTRFIMLGGGDTSFDVELADLLAHLGLPNLMVHPATSDYFPYYAAADLFVCSSFEESSPRVILETMVCGTPILSSAVQGVVEQVRHGLEAMLIPPGDTVALCESMAQLLFSPETGRALAERARARVVAEFDAKILLPRHAALARDVAACVSAEFRA